MVKVETFEPHPDHGRPRVAELSGREGTLAMHVNREDRSLWLFAQGPKGGDRGTVVVSAPRAGEVLAWLEDTSGLLGSGRGWVTVRSAPGLPWRWLTVGMAGWSRQWRMALDDAAFDALREMLREWAERAVASADASG